MNTLSSQERLDLAGRKFDDAAVAFGFDTNGFADSLINAEITIEANIQVKADELSHDKNAGLSRRLCMWN